MSFEKVNYIGGVMGKKGSGKSHLVKKALPHIPRYIVFDPLREYTRGVIFESWAEMVLHLDQWKTGNFRVIFRPEERREEESFDEAFSIINEINDYTLILEEADYHCNPHMIHPEIERLIKYGRHFRRNLIWLSRNAAEVHRDLSRQSDFMVTFRQTEPIDLKYLSQYSFPKPPETLEQYEYTVCGDEHLFRLVFKETN